jgi:hypothetical protein
LRPATRSIDSAALKNAHTVVAFDPMRANIEALQRNVV